MSHAFVESQYLGSVVPHRHNADRSRVDVEAEASVRRQVEHMADRGFDDFGVANEDDGTAGELARQLDHAATYSLLHTLHALACRRDGHGAVVVPAPPFRVLVELLECLAGPRSEIDLVETVMDRNGADLGGKR